MLGWLATTLGAGALRNGAASAAQRVGRGALIGAILATLWLTAFGFAVAALAVWLVGALGAIAGLAIVAALLAVAGLAVHLILHLGSRRPSQGEGLAGLGGGGSAAEAGTLGSLVLVAAAGYLLARQMHH